MRGLLVKNKFGKVWKDLVVATFAWRGENSHEKYRQCNGSLSCKLKAGLPVNVAGSLRINFVTKKRVASNVPIVAIDVTTKNE